MGRKGSSTGGVTDLARVHLEFAYDFDSNLAILAIVVACSIDVAEGAVTHLLNQRPALEAGVLGQLALSFALLSHDALENCWVNVTVLGAGSGVGLVLLLLAGCAGCDISGLCSNVAVVDGSDREVTVGSNLVLLLVHHGLADAGMVRLGVVVLPLGLVLCVDVGHVCGCLAVRGVPTCLFAMTQEVLEVLYCGHLSSVCAVWGRVGNFEKGKGGVALKEALWKGNCNGGTEADRSRQAGRAVVWLAG